MAALGDHAVVIPDRVLIANPGDHPTELMTLRGARLALLEELPEGRRLNTKRLKDTVGTSPITARAIARDNVTWPATHSLMLTTNYPPEVHEVDHGTWRRLARVEFPYTFLKPGIPPGASHERAGKQGLRERLAEGSDGRAEAVLAWVVEGARRWYAADKVMPEPPPLVVADTTAWRCEADRVLAYWMERLVHEPDSCVATTDLYSDFCMWLLTNGNAKWSDKTLADRFAQHEHVVRHGVSRKRVWLASRQNVSRPRWQGTIPSPLPERPWVWDGLRFRCPSDEANEYLAEAVMALPTSSAVKTGRVDHGAELPK